MWRGNGGDKSINKCISATRSTLYAVMLSALLNTTTYYCCTHGYTHIYIHIYICLSLLCCASLAFIFTLCAVLVFPNIRFVFSGSFLFRERLLDLGDSASSFLVGVRGEMARGRYAAFNPGPLLSSSLPVLESNCFCYSVNVPFFYIYIILQTTINYFVMT